MTSPDQQFDALGFTWDWGSVSDSLPGAPSGRESFEEATPRYVQNISAATGNPITLPEIQILHSGMSVGGRRLQDHNLIVDLLKAFRYVRLKAMRAADSSISFKLDKETVCKIHELAMAHSDDEPGKFRGEGAVSWGVPGFFRGYCPTPDDDGGDELRLEFKIAQEFLNSLTDPTERALAYYCLGVRNCFFLDGNKRTALLVMNGLLIQHRKPSVTISPSDLPALNETIDQFLYSSDATPLMLAMCAQVDPFSSGYVKSTEDRRAIIRAQRLLKREGVSP
ncbi:Fic family protein [Arthrobacter sp. NPDC093125]|uniref:Fic family protein n=1 Tax=Arthrobacter sp. NPDC093125 TaxID=3363944 RepID=UPI00382527FB